MKKYVLVCTALIVLVAVAASYTLFYSVDDIMGSAVVKPSPTATPAARRAVMPPVHAPEGTYVITASPADLTGKVPNTLTGLYMNEEVANRRPFAVVFNNNELSLPQSGLSQADIIYEVISEGSITRIIGIFQDFDSAKIGSIRSARHYFIDIALDYDAFFVHFGGSPQAYESLKTLKIDNINGIYLDGGVKTDNFDQVVFWRDADRWKVSNLREHSAFTNAANLIGQAEKAKYRLERQDFEPPFAFYNSFQSYPGAEPAQRISVSYGGGEPCVFEYDEKTHKYARFQMKGPKPHMDSETGEQITVDNVIVQLTSVKPIAGDTEGRRDVTLVGSGGGYLFTGGTVIPIKWTKAGRTSPTVWTFENGDKLMLNKGQTWICITHKEPEY